MSAISASLLAALTQKINDLSSKKSMRINRFGRDSVYDTLCVEYDAACAERKRLLDSQKVEEIKKNPHIVKNDFVAVAKVHALTGIKQGQLKVEQQRLRVEEQKLITKRKLEVLEKKQAMHGVNRENEIDRLHSLVKLLRQEVSDEVFFKCCNTVDILFPNPK